MLAALHRIHIVDVLNHFQKDSYYKALLENNLQALHKSLSLKDGIDIGDLEKCNATRTKEAIRDEQNRVTAKPPAGTKRKWQEKSMAWGLSFIYYVLVAGKARAIAMAIRLWALQSARSQSGWGNMVTVTRSSFCARRSIG